jgi:chloride channel 7
MFSSAELADKCGGVDELEISPEEMGMYVDLHPLTNTTPYTVVETMSVAKAVVLFRSVALRHMLIMPKFQGPEVSAKTQTEFYSLVTRRSKSNCFKFDQSL